MTAAISDERARAVGALLIQYGRELEVAGAAQVGTAFSGSGEADELIESDPNAFLLGLLFTQGIPAERAWRGPYLLRERLGSLDLQLLAGRPDLVRSAFQAPPMLHRFKEVLPRWISKAAARLLDEYAGDASTIWSGVPSVLDVVERLSAFDGIGRKKAVMAAEILRRHFGVEMSGQEHGQVAYDVHVRRVFLRSGLAEVDSLEAIEAAAAGVHPEAPALLDLPAWLIGRDTCRPKAPNCEECRLAAACERRVWITPKGVGVRTR